MIKQRYSIVVKYFSTSAVSYRQLLKLEILKLANALPSEQVAPLKGLSSLLLSRMSQASAQPEQSNES